MNGGRQKKKIPDFIEVNVGRALENTNYLRLKFREKRLLFRENLSLQRSGPLKLTELVNEVD